MPAFHAEKANTGFDRKYAHLEFLASATLSQNFDVPPVDTKLQLVDPEGAQEYTLLQEYYHCGTPAGRV